MRQSFYLLSNRREMYHMGIKICKNVCTISAHLSRTIVVSDGDFGKYFHLPVSVNFGKWILFTGKLPVNKKNQLTL
jgi:hypothetical protein